jgi:hypothetical protein
LSGSPAADRNFQKPRVYCIRDFMSRKIRKRARQLVMHVGTFGSDVLRPPECQPLSQLHCTLTTDEAGGSSRLLIKDQPCAVIT